MAKFQLGSYQHKKLFCGLMAETATSSPHIPSLEPDTKQRLGELDIWPWVYGQFQQFGVTAQAFSGCVKGSMLQGAIAQMGENDLALAQSVKTLAKKNRFGIQAQNSMSVSPSEANFKQACHQRNMLLFLASGLYELMAKEPYLQADVLARWNEALDIQACHVLFFINWLTFESQVKQKPEYELLGLSSLVTLRSQWLSVLGKLNRSDYDDNLPNNPKNIDHFLGQSSYRDLLNACEMGYQARFESFDERLIRPQTLAQTSRILRTLLGFWPQRVSATRPSSV